MVLIIALPGDDGFKFDCALVVVDSDQLVGSRLDQGAWLVVFMGLFAVVLTEEGRPVVTE